MTLADFPPIVFGPPNPDSAADHARSSVLKPEAPEHDDMAQVFDLLYQQLKAMARSQLRKRARGFTLCTTELVHELYLRFTRLGTSPELERIHFMALSARAMRHIIIDHARQRMSLKRGGEQPRTSLDENLTARDINVEQEACFLLAFDQALLQLARQDPRLAATCELRFFGGFTAAETAEILGVSTPTIKRDSRLARLFLSRSLNLDSLTMAATSRSDTARS